MKIISMELENFRQYREKQVIEFSTSEDKNFTIIEGANGAGKSNLLRAILWCMYGREGELLGKYDEENKVGIVNEQVLRELPSEEKTQVRVKLTLGSNQPEFIIERYIWFKKNTSSLEKLEEKFTVMEATDQGYIPANNSSAKIKSILPEEIKSFFFFDGEKLDDFFKPGRGTKVKKAVFDVSQIELLDRTIKHLEYVNNKLLKGQKNLSPRIQS